MGKFYSIYRKNKLAHIYQKCMKFLGYYCIFTLIMSVIDCDIRIELQTRTKHLYQILYLILIPFSIISNKTNSATSSNVLSNYTILLYKKSSSHKKIYRISIQIKRFVFSPCQCPSIKVIDNLISLAH